MIRFKVLVFCDNCKRQGDGYIEQSIGRGTAQALILPDNHPGQTWRARFSRTYCSDACQLAAEPQPR